jgi:rhamnose utilization protein RhaD (predicted bifunctional aldolase and dehydrogenase)
MESRYDPEAAARMVEDLVPRAPEVLAQRTYTARLVGSDSSLVLHGGGNTSVKGTAKTYCSGKRDGVRAGQAPSRIRWRLRSGRAIR